MLAAGTILIDEFRAAWLDGDPVEHAREMVPPGFTAAVDERVALDLYAAAVALMARLSEGVPAGCVAEEIVAASLMEQARTWLELRAEAGLLDAEDLEAASDELQGRFELFEDDDLLAIFGMAEPADAALAGHDPINEQLWRRGPTPRDMVRPVRMDRANGLPPRTAQGMIDRVSKPNAEWMRNSRCAECGMTPLQAPRRVKPA